MIMAYGAHLDTNQLHEIVGYLVTVNGIALKRSSGDSSPGKCTAPR